MEHKVINEEHYTFSVNKAWVKSTEQWHIVFKNKSDVEHTFEVFLTDFELQKMKDAL